MGRPSIQSADDNKIRTSGFGMVAIRAIYLNVHQAAVIVALVAPRGLAMQLKNLRKVALPKRWLRAVRRAGCDANNDCRHLWIESGAATRDCKHIVSFFQLFWESLMDSLLEAHFNISIPLSI